MATKTFEELKQLAIQIRDEKTNKQNTATRIGTQMLEHLDKLEQDYYDKTATDEELKERDEKLTELEEVTSENRSNTTIVDNNIDVDYEEGDGYMSSANSLSLGVFGTHRIYQNIPANKIVRIIIENNSGDAYYYHVTDENDNILETFKSGNFPYGYTFKKRECITKLYASIQDLAITTILIGDNYPININVQENKAKVAELESKSVLINNITANLVYPNKCTYGAVIKLNGDIDTAFPPDEYCVSEFIHVSGNNITANSFQQSGWGSYNVYDSNFNYLRTISNSASYTYQSGDVYVRICFRWNADISNIMANYGDVLLAYSEYSPIGGYLEKPLTRIDTIVDSKCDNLFTINLVDKSKCLSAKIISNTDNDFSDFSDAHYWATDYIPVAGRNISANSFQQGTFGSFVVYDKDKNPLAVIRNSALYEYKEARGDYYVRISIYSSNDNIVDFRANYGDSLQPYVEYKTIIEKISDNESSIAGLKDERYADASAQPVIGFDNLTEWFNSVFTSWPLVRDFDGGFNMKEILYKTTEATLELHNLSIVDGVLTDNGIAETITLDSSWLDPSLGQNVYRIPFKKTIQYIPAPKGFFADNSTLDDTGYISAGTIIENLPEDDEKHAIAFGIVARGFTTEYDKLREEITDIKENILENKKIGFLGDSITAMGYYISAFQQMSNCITVNYGVGGSHIAARSSDDNEAFEKRVPSLADDLDGVVVFGGTNDFGHTLTAPFGTFDDYTDEDIYSFYAGCHRTFKQLYDKYRGKPIVVMLPLHHGYEVDTPEYIFNEDGTITAGSNPTTEKTFKEYVDAIKQVAQYYSFYVIDAYSESGLNPCLETSGTRYYFTDGLHLNQVGGNRLGNFMLPLMEQVFSMFKNI